MISEKIICIFWPVLYNPTMVVCIPTFPIFNTYTFRNNNRLKLVLKKEILYFR